MYGMSPVLSLLISEREQFPRVFSALGQKNATFLKTFSDSSQSIRFAIFVPLYIVHLRQPTVLGRYMATWKYMG